VTDEEAWLEIEEGTLIDDGHAYPLYAIEVFRCRVTKRRLTVEFVNRSAGIAPSAAPSQEP
jgi:hypothetical protein